MLHNNVGTLSCFQADFQKRAWNEKLQCANDVFTYSVTDSGSNVHVKIRVSHGWEKAKMECPVSPNYCDYHSCGEVGYYKRVHIQRFET